MAMSDRQRMLMRLKYDPRKVLDDARQGQTKTLERLANVWDQLPDTLLPLGVLDVFILHLRADKVPPHSQDARKKTSLNTIAYMSLKGLSKAGNVISAGTFEDPDDPIIRDEWVKELTAAWPGVLAWSKYFFIGKCQAPTTIANSAQTQKDHLEIIAAAWYSMCHSASVRKAIQRTPGAVELATQMWVMQDKWDIGFQMLAIPTPSAALDAVLRNTPDPEDITPEVDNKTPIQRIVAAAGGNPDNVAKPMLSRLRTAINKPNLEPVSHVAIYLDLLDHFCHDSSDPLPFAFLRAGAITTVSKAAVAVVNTLNQNRNPDLLDAFSVCFSHLNSMLEIDEGFTSIVQAVDAGILTAFVDASPWFSKMTPDDQELVINLVSRKIPKYLVYRPVILAVHAAIQKLSSSPQVERIKRSAGAEARRDLCTLTAARNLLVLEARATAGKKVMPCDNAHCHEKREKNILKKCSACQSAYYCSEQCQSAYYCSEQCQSAYYCSEQCQRTDWNQVHKPMCKLKRAEMREKTSQGTNKLDLQFQKYIFPREACEFVPYLRQEATRKYPGVPITELMIQADYTVLPQTYDITKLSEFSRHPPEGEWTSKVSEITTLRNAMMAEWARRNPGKYALMQVQIANARTKMLVTAGMPGVFWNENEGNWNEGNVDVKEYVLEAFIEEIDKISLERVICDQTC